MLVLGKTLHKRYGHAVRVGPNEVWFDSAEAFKAIYGSFVEIRGGVCSQPQESEKGLKSRASTVCLSVPFVTSCLIE